MYPIPVLNSTNHTKLLPSARKKSPIGTRTSEMTNELWFSPSIQEQYNFFIVRLLASCTLEDILFKPKLLICCLFHTRMYSVLCTPSRTSTRLLGRAWPMSNFTR